jgi:uncharacterized membrane protein (DUF4010 family)
LAAGAPPWIGEIAVFEHPLFQPLGIALLLGLLVGLQRERTGDPLAGLRTFPLITILGTILAAIDSAQQSGGWVVAAGLVGLMGVLAIGTLHRLKHLETEPGITTEIAALLMFAIGAYLVNGDRLVAVAAGGGVAVLLQFKPELHGLAAKLNDRDLRAIMQFVLISFIILPVVPNRTFGPFAVLNPFNVWLMVVLIVGISLGGYIAYRFVGPTAGILLGGILGGAISSTATTASYARRVTRDRNSVWIAALVIAIASTVMYVRVLILIGATAPELFAAAAGPIGLVLAASVLAAAIGWLNTRTRNGEMPEMSNPSELRVAVVIALLYGLVLVALAAAKTYLGSQGLYLVAGLSGLTDVDAITLSTARLVGVGADQGGLDPALGWRLIVVATLTNFAFKAGMVALLGNRQLLARTAALFALPAVVGIAVLWVWPAAC